MAGNYMGNMTFGVNFKVDTKGLTQIEDQFTKIGNNLKVLENQATKNGNNTLKTQIQQATKSADQLYEALMKSYNIKLGQFDISKLNAELTKSKTSLSTVATDLSKVGLNINSIHSTLLNSRVMIKESNQFLDKMAVTFGNTVRWQITNKIINTITGSIQKAYYFVKDLDTSLNDIRIVTGKSADEMERFARQATAAAQALGKTTTDYTKASLLYYQQGLSDKEVAARAQTTLKAANVTGQSTSEVSEQLTAVWNGYKVSAEETERYVDKLSAVAASTASNLEELSTGMSKVASAANMMGVDIDQLNAQLSTVISVTRQAPETIGAAFKTIYSRMSTIKAGGIDEEDGATLTSYSEKMNNFGISVLDANGNLRDMGEVIEEIGNKWETLNREQQVGLAQAMGGTRQYSNLTALFENWDKYQTALKTSQTATGTLQKQQEIYMDSISAHFEQLTAEAEKFYQAILDEDALKDIADGLKFIVEQLNNFIQGIGGAGNALISFGATATNLFSHKIGVSLGQQAIKNSEYREEKDRLDQLKNYTKQIASGNAPEVARGAVTKDAIRTSNREDHIVVTEDAIQKQAINEQKIFDLGKNINAEQRRALSDANEELALLRSKLATYKALENEAGDIVLDYEYAIDNIKKWEKELEKLEKTQANLQSKQMQNNAKMVNLSYEGEDFATAKGAQSTYATKDNAGNYHFNFKGQGSYQGYLRQAKNYYEALQKENALTKEQELTLQKITEQFTKINALKDKDKSRVQVVQNQEAEELIKQIEEDRLKVLNEIAQAGDGQAEDLDKAKQKAIELDEQLKKVKNDIEGPTGLKTLVDSENNTIEDNEPLIKLAKEIQDGGIEHTEAAINAKEESLTKAIDNQNRIKNSVGMIQKLSGAVKAGTALVGGLTTALDKTLSATERINGQWEAITGTIVGGAAAINPMLGMLTSGIVGLAKSIMDATGITEKWAKEHQTTAEKIQTLKDNVKNATEELNKATQSLNEYAQKIRDFHNNIKNLESLKESWDAINAKKKAGIALTDEEKEQYQSMVEQILNLNHSITYTYDEQHNLILSNNNALDDTIEKLQKEYELQKKIEGKTARDEAFRKLSEARQAKAEYDEAYKKYEENKSNIVGFNTQYTKIAQLLESGNFVNVNATSGADIIEEGTQSLVNDLKQYFHLDENGNIDKAAYNKLIEFIAEDENAQTKLNEKFDTLVKNSSEGSRQFSITQNDIQESMIKGTIGTPIVGLYEAIDTGYKSLRTGIESIVYGVQDDIDDVFENLKQDYSLDFIARILTGITDPVIDEFNNTVQDAIDASVQSFSWEFQDNIDSIDSKLVEQMIIQQAEESFKRKMDTQGDDFDTADYDQAMNDIVEESNKFAKRLSKCSDVLEEAAEAIGQLDLKKTQMSATEYVKAVQEQYEKVQNEANTRGVVLQKSDLDLIFGKNNYGTNLENIYNGLRTQTVTTPYGSSYEKVVRNYQDIANSIFGQGTWQNAQNNYDETYFEQKIPQFLEKILANPDIYAKYGSDWATQFEGFLHDEYGGKIFKDYLQEINDDLDNIKSSALSGEELDTEVFERLTAQLYKYRDQLQNVSTEREILADKDLYGTQVWYESLQRIEQELQRVQEQILLDERNQLIVNIKADGTMAKETLNDLLNQDYKIIADIEIQHKDSYETAVKEVENLHKALSYVGEDGRVAADNLLELLNAVPELNDMITELNSDGSISLTEEQIELIKQKTQVEIDGNIAIREMELQTQLNRIQQEKKRVQEQIKLTEETIEAHKTEAKDKAEFEKAFLQIYAKYNDTQEQITEENNDAISTDSWQTADAVSQYWVDAYNDADAAYQKFVDNVVEGNKVLRGDQENWEHQEFDVSSGVAQVKGEDNKTDSQKLLDDAIERAKGAENEVEAFYNQVLLNLRKELEALGLTEEELENEMLSLHAIGLKNVNDAKNLGKATKEAAWAGKDLYDVYHNINKELEFINQKLTIMQKKEKLLKDDALLKNLQAQTTEYEKQIKALNEKRAIARGYAEEIRTRETTAEGNKGLSQYGLEFDEYGNITNYEEVAARLQANQNSAESVEDYENFNTQYKLYEEQIKTLRELEGQLYDAVAKRQELQTKAIEVKIDMILDVSKAEKQYLEFTKKLGNFSVDLIINPDQSSVDAAAAQAATSFIKATIEALPEQNALLKEGTKKLNQLQNGKKSVIWNGDTYYQEDIYKLQENTQSLASSIEQTTEDVQQAYQGTLDSYSNALKELNDWDKRVLAKYDMINGVYDHAEKLTELWYGKDSLEAQLMLTNFAQDKTDNLTKQAEEANEQVKRNWQEYQDALRTDNAQLAKDTYDMWAESIQNLQKLTEQWAEQRKQQLTDELALAAKIVETQIYGGKSREKFANSWELLNKQAETYLDTINAQFGVTKLENKYIQAINNSIGNTKAQEKINKIMSEEMKMLKEKDKLTKYDLERAEAKYELTLKQIALEEARDNKTNLRLRRDSQGNYTYQYTANEEDILKAQNDVDIAKNNLYNMDRDRYQDLTDKAITTEKEYYDKLSEIQNKFADDEEARFQAEEELYNAYFGPDGILTGILNERVVAFTNLNESIDDSLNGTSEGTLLNSFEKLKTNLVEKVEELSPALNSGIQAIIDKWTDEETGVAGAYITLQKQSEEFFVNYIKDVTAFANAIDQDDAFGKVRNTFIIVKTKVDDFKEAASNATTALGLLNEKGSEFSLKGVFYDLLQVSSVFGDGTNDGLIKRINDAHESLKDLVKPKKKLENLEKIKLALAEQKKTLEENDGAFKKSKKAVKNYYKEIIDQANDAIEIAGKVKNAIDAIPTNKTSTITTIHVDKYEGSKSSSGGNGGTVPVPLNTGENTSGGKKYWYIPIKSSNGEWERYGNMFFESESDAKAMAKSSTIAEETRKQFSTTMLSIEAGTLKDSPQDRIVMYDPNAWKQRTVKFDSGGYTGIWGDQGRLAMLHEKELVLNKDDTQNILNAVDLIRQIDKNVLESKVMETLEAYKQQMAVGAIESNGQATTINQNITINADFPDATDRDEIKAAFDSLVNLASQRIMTKQH